MLFWLKKLISGFLLPTPFGLFWIALGIFLLLIGKAKRMRLCCIIVGFVIITAFSLNPISFQLLNSLQSQYAPLLFAPTDVTQVVVLGGGIGGKKDYPPNLTLNSASLSRLVEGVRVLKLLQIQNPNAQLILSGGRVFQSPAVAGKMRNAAMMLGVDQKNIVLEDGSTDTHKEALFLKKFVGKNPFILVTSAYHMPRAMDLFRGLNMHPIAAPTQFIGYHYDFWAWCIPSANSLAVSDIALHEYLGILWAKMRGDI